MILLVALFWLNPSLTQGGEDLGDPDTLHLVPYESMECESFPCLVRVHTLVTHDLNPLDGTQDSIAGIVIPLFYTHSNASKYCSTTSYNNDLCVGTACDGLPPWVLSVFRHVIEDEDTLIHNWMMDLSKKPYPYNKEDWDSRILDLGVAPNPLQYVSHWWLSLATAGTDDRGMEEGSRVLIATMTFMLEDTMTICIDTGLWEPSSRLQFGHSYAGGGTWIPQFESICFKVDTTGTGVKEIQGSEDSRPSEFSLSQNYPNPFNPATNFQFSLSRSVHVRVEIFNIVGQKVRTLVDEQMKPGVYLVDWDGEDEKGNLVSSGIYFYRIQAGDFSDMKKMVLIK